MTLLSPKGSAEKSLTWRLFFPAAMYKEVQGHAFWFVFPFKLVFDFSKVVNCHKDTSHLITLVTLNHIIAKNLNPCWEHNPLSRDRRRCTFDVLEE